MTKQSSSLEGTIFEPVKAQAQVHRDPQEAPELKKAMYEELRQGNGARIATMRELFGAASLWCIGTADGQVFRRTFFDPGLRVKFGPTKPS